MEYRTYGKTDLSVSVICYGTMRYAAKGGVHDDRSRAGARALEEAIDQGINFIHSSYEYGTRWLTGEVLGKHPRRHELHHIIKVNVPDWGEPVFDARVFRSQIEDALRELHTDRIAVVQHLQRGTVPRELGYCADGEPQRVDEFDALIEPLQAEFERLKDEGKVGYLATFPYTVGYARRAIESGAFSGVVAYFNALETEMYDLFADMAERGMGFVGIRPLGAGLLTDRRVDRGGLPSDDRLRDAQFDRLYDQLAELQKALAERPESWTRFAYRTALADPRTTSTVVSINTSQQLRDAVESVGAPYPECELLEAANRICADYRTRHGVTANGAGIPTY